MKRLHTLVVLLGLALGLALSGCTPSDSSAPASTNAPPAVPSTNK